ncbi:hypothetical protein KUTG_04140 [Kutzneria sp. 744]|nr:hypothetical protein KUTG_04140 [Kutzneria sp. 744]
MYLFPGSGHPSWPAVAGRLQRPTRRHRAGSPRTPAQAPRAAPSWPCSGWGLPSHPGHPGCWWSLTPPFHPYPAASRRPGGLFSVALSRGSPRVAVSNHPALWSPDFPRRRTGARRRGRPADSSASTSLVRARPRVWNGLVDALTVFGLRALLAAWSRFSDSPAVVTWIWSASRRVPVEPGRSSSFSP